MAGTLNQDGVRKMPAEVIMKKVVLLGDSAVGKTSLIRRFVEDNFDDDYISTIGAKVSKKIIPTKFKDEDWEVKLMVWDIIGSQGFESTQSRHIAGVNGAILVVDLTKPETLKGLEEYWIPLLKDVSGGVLPAILFAGNKNDLIENKADVLEMIGEMKALESKYCQSLETRMESGCGGWLLTSAKTGVNVEKGFDSLVLGMMEEHPTFDPLNRQMENMIAEGIYASSDRNTPRSIMDMIIIDLPQIMRSMERSTQILQETIERLGFSKDDPTPENILNFIEMTLIKALDDGAKPHIVEDYRKKWFFMLSKVK